MGRVSGLELGRGAMGRLTIILMIAILVVSCATKNMLVYSSGFSFANYDYLVIGAPDPTNSTTSLFGMDIEFANLLGRYNMKIIGDIEYESISPENQKRTLYARMALNSNGKNNLLSVSFDDATTGRTGASITALAKGNMFDDKDRKKAFEAVSKTIIKALEKDKGLTISDDRR